VDAIGGNVGEVDVPLPVHGRAFGELEAFGDKLPILAGDQNLAQRHILRQQSAMAKERN
jgi:hypothetical protein